MSDTNLNINPNEVIEDLLNQIKQLTADNSMLRAGMKQLQEMLVQVSEAAAEEDKSSKKSTSSK
tara:strand:- start:23120 stop:23311 length:192 start_codon:yes stop_codon:yes gene_type:complete